MLCVCCWLFLFHRNHFEMWNIHVSLCIKIFLLSLVLQYLWSSGIKHSIIWEAKFRVLIFFSILFCCIIVCIISFKSWMPVPRSGELWVQKLKSHLMRTQSLKVLPLKPRVGQYLAMHATLTARDFFLANFYPLVHSPAFFLKLLPSFSC